MSALSTPLNLLQTTQNVLKQSALHPPANLPVPNPTKSFWIDWTPDTNIFAREGSEGTLTPDADICIIGSGVTGMQLTRTREKRSALGVYQASVLHITCHRLSRTAN
jgi:hypothetical protein